jgi:hypothetical protein
MPVPTAPTTVTSIQLMPMCRAVLISARLRIAMKRTMMCGWPK